MKALILFLISTSLFAQEIDYKRSDWKHWVDKDKDCQNARAELLIRESLGPVTFKNEKECVVLSGEWYGNYLAKKFTIAKRLDVDHIIPLKWAHTHGGWRWSKEQKQVFANDYENLLLVDLGRNRRKGSKGIGDWMPDNKPYECTYVFRWRYLLAKYDLIPGEVDREAIDGFHRGCLLN